MKEKEKLPQKERDKTSTGNFTLRFLGICG